MELKLSDLFIECDACKGTGQAQSQPRTPLGTPGVGKSNIVDGSCNVCNGKRGKVTEAGQVLIEFKKKVLDNSYFL